MFESNFETDGQLQNTLENAIKMARQEMEVMGGKKKELGKTLESEKEVLDGIAENDVEIQQRLKQIEAALLCVETAGEDALESYAKPEKILKSTDASLENVTQEIVNVEKVIKEIKLDHQVLADDLENKKFFLRKRVESLDNLETVISAVTKQIICSRIAFKEKLNFLEKKSKDLIKSANLSGEELTERLKEIENQVEKLKKMYCKTTESLEEQRKILDKEYQIKAGKVQILKSDFRENAPTVSSKSCYTPEDTEYLKITLGTPLSLGLAEIVSKQPADPIHYLSHWLLKYRYNEDAMELKKRELEELIFERHRLAEELEKRKTEIEAYNTIIDMIRNAEMEAERRALLLRNMLLEEEEENEDQEENENEID